MSQTDWLVVGFGVLILWGLSFLSRQIEELKDAIAPDDDDEPPES